MIKSLFIAVLVLAVGSAFGGITVVDSDTDGFSSGTGAVTGVFNTVSAQVGDVIVVTAATNKKGSVQPLSLVRTGGTGAADTPAELTNGLGTYPTSWGWYQTVTAAGTFAFELVAENITAGGAIYVLRADSGQIMLADSATWDDTDTANNGTSYSLDYSFATNLTDGVAIEAISSRSDLITEPAGYAEDYNGSDKRVITHFDGVTGVTLSSIYTLSGGLVDKQTSGALGMVFAEGSSSGNPPEIIAPDHPRLVFQGSEYITVDGTGAYFQRHADAVLALSTVEKGFDTQKAKTTTGIAMSFKTDSPFVHVQFTHDLSPTVENRNSRFGVYEEGAFAGSHYFSKTESNLSFTVNSSSPGTASVFRLVLPNWAKPDFRGLELDPGASLMPLSLPVKKTYVVMGDSISHGTGQGSTYATYPWILSELLGTELFNLAVGGSKVSVPAAEMLSEFPAVDAISILIGYNDLHGAGKTAVQFAADLNAMLDAVRTSQPNAELFCISPIYTTNPTNTTTGEAIEDFRQAVYDEVALRQTAGDEQIHLIRGEDLTTAADLNDVVHLSEAGAAHFATNLFQAMDPVVNPPITPQTGRTNIVMIVVDDLGWMDLSVQGSAFYETPRIDELAAGGMRFTQGYCAHPRCLPSRYGLMTGRFPGANGVPGGPENNLRPGETTVAEALQADGYATAFMGKWHLIGTHGEDNLPQNQGFDINISGGKPGAPDTYFHPYAGDGTPTTNYELDTNNELYFDNDTPAGGMVTDRITGASYLRTAERGLPGEYVTDRLTDEAIDWMDWNADKPMFLCVWHYGVHTPYEAPASLILKYEAKLPGMDYGDLPEYIPSGVGQQKMRQDHPTYAAMIESVDTNIGRLMDKVEELGISSNTVFIFTSDNGGLSTRGGYNNRELATANYPLRTGKGWLYEGGIREAFIVTGAGVTPMVNSNAVVTGTDIYPTCLELAGTPLQPSNHHDGVSFVPALKGETYERGEPIFWHCPLARPYSTGDFNSSAVRDGDYKLIWWYDTPGKNVELYNVKTDPGENVDLSEAMPARTAELLGLIQAWHAGSHKGSGVIFKTDADDVSKPPRPYLEDATVPLSITPSADTLHLEWGDYLGFDYDARSRDSLTAGGWTVEAQGLTTNGIVLPLTENQSFYQAELVLQPKS